MSRPKSSITDRPRSSMTERTRSSTTDSDASDFDSVYSILLHVVEARGLKTNDYVYGPKDKVVIQASLNGIKFELDSEPNDGSAIFNSNCVWESEMNTIIRLKRENRPIKLECHIYGGLTPNAPKKNVGTLLLPVRSIQISNATKNLVLDPHWHNLCTVNLLFKEHTPALSLLLIIVKKSMVDSGQIQTILARNMQTQSAGEIISETALMLQSHSNVYVQLLDQVGLIQVGNNADIDCDIFKVTITFKHVKNVKHLLELEQADYYNKRKFAFHYEFLGSVSHNDLVVQPNDSYKINEKMSLSFKTSMHSLRLYFQRIFFIPIYLYSNGTPIANYHFDCTKMLPDDDYFNTQTNWTEDNIFYFNHLHKILSPGAERPFVDFFFNIQLVTRNSKPTNCDVVPIKETFLKYNIDGPCNDSSSIERGQPNVVATDDKSYRSMNREEVLYFQKYLPYENNAATVASQPASSCPQQHCNNVEDSEKIDRTNPMEDGDSMIYLEPVLTNAQPLSNRSMTQSNNGDEVEKTIVKTVPVEKQDVSVETDDLQTQKQSIAINTDELPKEIGSPAVDTEELSLKIVQELEDWKEQQMEHFIEQLTIKEYKYMENLKDKWSQQRSVSDAQLETTILKCEKLEGLLEQTHNELQATVNSKQQYIDVVDTVKRDLEGKYARKIETLDKRMQLLNLELEQKCSVFEMQKKEVQMENTHLECERAELKDRITLLEQQLAVMEKNHLSADQLKDVLTDMHKTNTHFSDMEKSRNYYKEELTIATREMNKLKLSMLKDQEEGLREEFNVKGFSFNLEEILTEEQDALKSDRNELNSIREILSVSSEASSEDT